MDNVKILSRIQDKLYDELENYVNAEFKAQNCIDSLDKILHSIKSASTVLAMEGYDGGNSGYYRGGSDMMRPYYNRTSSGYDNGYSKGVDEEYIRKLKELKTMAPDDHIAQEIQRMIEEAYRTR